LFIIFLTSVCTLFSIEVSDDVHVSKFITRANINYAA